MTAAHADAYRVQPLCSGWCRKDKRVAVYARGGCRCAFCGVTLDVGGRAGRDASATLEHVTSRAEHVREALTALPESASAAEIEAAAKGALRRANRAHNLVPSCFRCNSLKRDLSREAWAALAREALGVEVDWPAIDAQREQPLAYYRRAAKQLLAGRTTRDLTAHDVREATQEAA